MVMLHIELKGMAHAATWWQILSPQTPPPQYMLQMVALTTIHRRHNAQKSRNVTGWDQNFKLQRFQNMIMLHIKLNDILPLHTPLTPGVWPNAQKHVVAFF